MKRLESVSGQKLQLKHVPFISYNLHVDSSQLWQSPVDPNRMSFSLNRYICVPISLFRPHSITKQRAQRIIHEVITCVLDLV